MQPHVLAWYEFVALLVAMGALLSVVVYFSGKGIRRFSRRFGEGTTVNLILVGVSVAITWAFLYASVPPSHKFVLEILLVVCAICGPFSLFVAATHDAAMRKAVAAALEKSGAPNASRIAARWHFPEPAISKALKEIGLIRLTDAIAETKAKEYATSMLLRSDVTLDDASRKKLISVIVQSKDAFAARDVIYGSPFIDDSDRKSLLSTFARRS